MAKLERKLLAHFINAGTDEAPCFVRLGKDLEEFSPELSASVEHSKNILGQTSVVISGYEKSGAVSPFYAEAGDPLFEKLEAIIDGDLTLDALKVRTVDVKLWKPGETENRYEAVAENAYLEVTGYGGDTTGIQIPFVLHYTGEKVKGEFDIREKLFYTA